MPQKEKYSWELFLFRVERVMSDRVPKRLPQTQTRLQRLTPLSILTLLVAVALACSLPSFSERTSPTPTPTLGGVPVSTAEPPPVPTPTQQALPPALVESDPSPGSQVAASGPITLYFNQAMDQASVEAGLTTLNGISGQVDWQDAATVSFIPDEPLPPGSKLILSLDTGVRAAHGIALSEPVSLDYQVAGYLHLTQKLPEAGTIGADPASAVVAAFNRPVVPLGADPASLPAAFQLEPAVEGQGEWINTSTYIFYPAPALAGGVEYTAQLNPDITSTDGSPLERHESWSFTTESPQLLSIEPASGARAVRLDSPINLNFNQPMDADSVAGNFTLLDSDQNVIPGVFSWDEGFTVATYRSTNLLKRDMAYTLVLDEAALSLGGTPLGSRVEARFQTVPALAVTGTDPLQNGLRNVYASVAVHFSAPVQIRNVLQFITLSPRVPGLQSYLDEDGRTLRLFGDFSPDTFYTLIISPNLPDAWSGRLGADFVLNFRTLPLEPDLVLAYGQDVLFLTPQDPGIRVQVTNLPQLSFSLGSLPIEDLPEMLAFDGEEFRQSYVPVDQRTHLRGLEAPANSNQVVDLALNPQGGPLDPGLYHLKFILDSERIHAGPFLLVSSHVNLTLKLSATDALVWAVDLRDNSPVIDAPVSIWGADGGLLASGVTDSEGVFRAEIANLEDVYSPSYAIISEPGEELFGLALSSWVQGLDGWNFSIQTDYSPARLSAYLYTDRPIYRPGQMLYFRAVLRQAYNGRYSLPDETNLPDGRVAVTLFDQQGEALANDNFAISEFGTIHGSFLIPEGAEPGNYRLEIPVADHSSISLQVAEYRKPEIDLRVSFPSEQTVTGQPLEATVDARYFFDAPAGGQPVRWTLYREPSYFSLPGYQVGVLDTAWLSPFPAGLSDLFGEVVTEGTGSTDRAGRLKIEFTPPASGARQRYTLEATLEDESGFPVSARGSIEVNPADFYIGVRPDVWVGQAGALTGFEVQLVDWDMNPAGAQPLQAEFNRVIWEQVPQQEGDPFGLPTYIPQYTLVGSTDFVTARDGVARLAFTPPEPGTYQLDVSGEGTLTQLLLWVGGPGQATWPNLPSQRLRLTSFQETYRPGDTAQVFVPNPFAEEALALVTVERGIVLRHRVLTLQGAGTNLSIPLGEEDAPNVYVSVTLIGKTQEGLPDYRQGYINLPVDPVKQRLNLELVAEPTRTGPGDQVSFDLRITDADGEPVAGELSLAVVDQAVLALADQNSADMLEAFYGNQSLGVRTSLALSAYTRRSGFFPEGLGGGGGGGELYSAPLIRERFLDTSFWKADIVTDEAGEASVSLALPDNLTTWEVGVRALTADTRVGQAEAQIITTKDLLVRPVTPRFLVYGDHALLAAVVHNNTGNSLRVEASIQANGFDLDDPASALQQVVISAGRQMRVEWWGSPQDVDSIELIFSARAANPASESGEMLEDTVRPELGTLPVLRYTAPQTFATSGLLDGRGQRIELVSLPRSFEPRGGRLYVELSPSLAAAMMNSLEALENQPSDFSEQVLSRFLPNLHTYRVLREFGLEAPGLQARLDRSLQEGLPQLLARQNEDGGWGWWKNEISDPYISAYVLFGLSQARSAGVTVDGRAIQRATSFLRASLPAPEMLSEPWQYDRLAFVHFALAQAGAGDLEGVEALFEAGPPLAPWAKALLALTLERLSPGDPRVQTLLSDLSSSAVRSATGTHWEDQHPGWQNFSTPVYTTAVTLYALAQRDPASPLVADGVRYLMAHRGASGVWASAYETAWTLMALAEVMRGTGELGGEFNFAAALNNNPLAGGQAGGGAQLTPATASAALDDLYWNAPNALLIEREAGPGRLYYSARLQVNRPVESAPALNQGISLSRAYYATDCLARAAEGQTDCASISSARAGGLVTVRLTLTVPETAYYLVLEDYFPAGTEVLDTSLKTSQQGASRDFDPRRPFQEGWGWWYFGDPQVYGDHVTWAVQTLPPGTYELTYTLVTNQPGEYRVLPTRAWQVYFPEVQGTSAGEIFTINKP